MQYVICSRMKLKFHVSYRILSPLAYFLEKTHQIYSRHMLKVILTNPQCPTPRHSMIYTIIEILNMNVLSEVCARVNSVWVNNV